MATPAQIEAIRKLTHNANQIIDRAMEGQKEHLQWNVKAMTGAERFSAKTQGLTYKQAEKKLEDLNAFYEAKSVYKAGWKEIVNTAVKNARDTLINMKNAEGKPLYNLTESEIAGALKKLNTMRKKDKNRYIGMTLQQKKQAQRSEFYNTINKVQAEKNRKGTKWKGTAQEIGRAMAKALTDEQIVLDLIQSREQ